MYITEINKWFENCYKWVLEAERAERLGKAWEQEDKLLKTTYHSLTELDLKAEEMKAVYKAELANIEQRRQEWLKKKAEGGAK